MTVYPEKKQIKTKNMFKAQLCLESIVEFSNSRFRMENQMQGLIGVDDEICWQKNQSYKTRLSDYLNKRPTDECLSDGI